MEIELLIDIENMDNSSQKLYPGKEIYVSPMINKSSPPTQPNGTIYIEFDNDLSFTGNAEVFIDFSADSCFITYDNMTLIAMIQL